MPALPVPMDFLEVLMDSVSLENNRRRLLEAGVEMLDPSAVYVEDSVTVGRGTPAAGHDPAWNHLGGSQL